ncbi:hypothetical protein [Paludibacterium yongneupense]|nr:hypothetical protein [Paludibacterium yongneupense]
MDSIAAPPPLAMRLRNQNLGFFRGETANFGSDPAELPAFIRFFY